MENSSWNTDPPRSSGLQLCFDRNLKTAVITNQYELRTKHFALAWTKEYVTLPIHSRIAARVEGKSSLARLGIGVHCTAPTIHSDFEGTIQLEIYNFGDLDIIFDEGMRVCQLIFEYTAGTPTRGYSGIFSKQTP
jgi:dCTP deaminase